MPDSGTPREFTWDDAQRQIVRAPAAARLLVEAPPGFGKTAVACGRVASLIDDEDVPGSKILLISFTRTAIAELRNRIRELSTVERQARSVRISTIDSHAWQLRVGFEDAEAQALGAAVNYESNLDRALDLIREGEPQLVDFLAGLRHVVVDEAQDVVGIRSIFAAELIRHLPDECGVTVFADEAQAIYGFTTDYEEGPSKSVSLPFVAELLDDNHLGFQRRSLTTCYRTSNQSLLKILTAARSVVLDHSGDARARLKDVTALLETAPRSPDTVHEDLKGDMDALVLFRWRSEVLFASSYLANEGVQHRLRMSRLPTIIHPWIGWVLALKTGRALSEGGFGEVWQTRFSEAVCAGWEAGGAWALLRQLAPKKGDRSRVDLERLRDVLARTRPPIQACLAESGFTGPILGTIHASKGREAERVRLMLPKKRIDPDAGPAQLEEETRVLYVGASRAREHLDVGDGYASGSSSLDGSNRVYRRLKGANGPKVQVQIGMDGDIDEASYASGSSAGRLQDSLAQLHGSLLTAVAVSDRHNEWLYQIRVRSHDGTLIPLGYLARTVNEDLWTLAKQAGSFKPPPEIRHLYVTGVRTVAVPETAADQLSGPYNRSRLFLVPVVQGFTSVPLFRHNRRGPR